jgi:hypothetical protein
MEFMELALMANILGLAVTITGILENWATIIIIGLGIYMSTLIITTMLIFYDMVADYEQIEEEDEDT